MLESLSYSSLTHMWFLCKHHGIVFPVAKRELVKLKFDEMVWDGKLAKVEEPTA